MKQLRMYIAWPIIFLVAYYFWGLSVALLIGILFLYLMILLLVNSNEQQAVMLAKIVEHMRIIDPKKIEMDFENISTAKDAIKAIEKMNKGDYNFKASDLHKK